MDSALIELEVLMNGGERTLTTIEFHRSVFVLKTITE